MAGVLFPQVEFFIGEKSLMVPPNHITSFLYEDTIAMAGDSYTLEFIDPSWTVLESDLIPSLQRNQDKAVSFRYGWNGNQLSELRYGTVTEFVPSEITRGGIRIVMKGWDTASSEADSHRKIEATYQGLISDVVRQIAERRGWSVDIEETQPIYELEGREAGKQLKKWRQANKTDLEFINELSQRAKSASSGGAYRVYFDSRSVPPVLHFHTDRAHQYPLHREYVVQEDNLGQVIIFTPQVEGAAVVGLGASQTNLVYREKDTRKLIEKTASPESFSEGVALGSKSATQGGSPVKKSIPPSSDEEGQARLESYFEGISWAVNRANLEVVGDPFLEPGRLISVIVQTPSGKKYFISGVYLLEKAIHNITPGNYTTQCELIKNAFDVGDLALNKGTIQRG